MYLEPKEIIKIVDDHASYLQFNSDYIDIFDNNLTPYVLKDLEKQLSPQSFEQIKHRVAPINILPKFIDKLTNIFQTSVTREVVGGNDNDQFIVSSYEKVLSLNDKMDTSNELYNLCNSSLLYPTIRNNTPVLDIIENDHFIPLALDPSDRSKLTHVIILAGERDGLPIYWVYSDRNIYAVDGEGKIRPDLMQEVGNPEGFNPIGRLPFVYFNNSRRSILPNNDRDGMKIIKLIPVMLSDLNLAAMFQCFSILYGIDVSDENMVFAPNAFWRFTTSDDSEKKPEIGSIKPNVDYEQVLGLIQAELSMWLNTRGVRAGSVGELKPDNFASGISKIIDEMDTYEARQKQTTIFKNVESEFWDLLLNYMHPYWNSKGLTVISANFSPSAYVDTQFSIQLPMQKRGQIVSDLEKEVSAGFLSRRRAIKKLNPEMSEREIDELIEEIDKEVPRETDENRYRNTEGLEAGSEG